MEHQAWADESQIYFSICLNKINEMMQKYQYIAANDFIEKSLEHFPDNIILQELNAKNLMKLGAFEKAIAISKGIIKAISKNHSIIADFTVERKSQIYQLLAEIYKEEWKFSRSADSLKKYAMYLKKSFKLDPTPHTGIDLIILEWLSKKKINVSSLSVFIKTAEKLDQINPLYFNTGIAYLILNDQKSAYAKFKEYVHLCNEKYYLINQLFQELKFLIKSGLTVDDKILDLLSPPSTIVFEGPSINQFKEWGYSFSSQLEKNLKNEIKQIIESTDAKICFCIPYAGTNIIFLETMLERNAEVNLVLPFVLNDFIKHYITPSGQKWVVRFNRILERAANVTYASKESYVENGAYHQFAYLLQQGLAISKSNILSSTVYFLVVWDPEFSQGGLEDSNISIDHWSNPSTLRVIDLQTIVENIKPIKKKSIRVEKKEAETESTSEVLQYLKKEIVIRSLLFSDLVGFSKMKNQEIVHFLRYLEKMQSNLDLEELPQYHVETHGDSIFVLMDSAYNLTRYALFLSKYMNHIKLESDPDTPAMEMRIALHAGFVFKVFNPVTHRDTFYGQSIVRVARLEPVTVPGKIYATSEFVSLLTLDLEFLKAEYLQKNEEFISPFKIDFVGSIDLAKNYGTESVYKIGWHSDYKSCEGDA